MKPTGRKHGLKILELRITLNCNLRCLHCSVGDVSLDRAEYLAWPEYDSLIRQAKSLGAEKIDVTGGEPLTEKELTLKIIRLSSRLGMETQMNTNATLITDGIIAELHDAGLDLVRVSLDGSNRDVYERVRGDGRNFGKVVRGLKLLVESGHFTVGGRFTITAANYADIGNCIGLAEDLGLDFIRIKPVVRIGKALGNPALHLSAAQQAEAIRLAIERKREGIIDVHFRGPCMQFLLGDSDPDGIAPCDCARTMLSVSPTGELTPCAYLGLANVSVGNVREKSLRDLFGSDIVREMRESVPDNCAGCAHLPKCGGGCMAMNYNAYGTFSKSCRTCQDIKRLLPNPY